MGLIQGNILRDGDIEQFRKNPGFLIQTYFSQMLAITSTSTLAYWARSKVLSNGEEVVNAAATYGFDVSLVALYAKIVAYGYADASATISVSQAFGNSLLSTSAGTSSSGTKDYFFGQNEPTMPRFKSINNVVQESRILIDKHESPGSYVTTGNYPQVTVSPGGTGNVVVLEGFAVLKRI